MGDDGDRSLPEGDRGGGYEDVSVRGDDASLASGLAVHTDDDGADRPYARSVGEHSNRAVGRLGERGGEGTRGFVKGDRDVDCGSVVLVCRPEGTASPRPDRSPRTLAADRSTETEANARRFWQDALQPGELGAGLRGVRSGRCDAEAPCHEEHKRRGQYKPLHGPHHRTTWSNRRSSPTYHLRVVRLLAILLGLSAAAVIAVPAQAAAPRYILVSGAYLPRPVTLGDQGENVRLFSLLLHADRPSPGWQANRTGYDLALFWIVMGARPTQPAKADQHGWFYPATGGRRAVIKLLIDGQDFPRVVPPKALSILSRHGIPTRSAPAPSASTFNEDGVRATLPSGWWATNRRMSSGIEPIFRLTVLDRPLLRTSKDEGPCYGGIGKQIQPRAVVAILREAVGADFKPARFSKRPVRFVLSSRQPGQDNSCLGDHATLISFKDAGRGFYLWIAAGRDAPQERVERLLTLLNGLSIARSTP